ncbi:hypothetical protein CR513_29918, partial [Mucuna pruriens]
MSAHLVPSSIKVGQLDPKALNDKFSSLPPPTELKPLPSHLMYTYLDTEQQLSVIIANNLHQKNKPFHLQAQNFNGGGSQDYKRRMNPTILDVVKKEVTKLLVVGIIYLISNSQWVSPMQVVPKKSGMTVMKN